jgi:hypothetical protein
MRLFVSILSALFILASGKVDAQVDRPRTKVMTPAYGALPNPSAQTPDEIRARGRHWFTQCMADWEIATHMTKKEWERTCRRVAIERTKFLIDEQGKR